MLVCDHSMLDEGFDSFVANNGFNLGCIPIAPVDGTVLLRDLSTCINYCLPIKLVVLQAALVDEGSQHILLDPTKSSLLHTPHASHH